MTGSDLLVIIGLPATALAVGLVFGILVPRARRRQRHRSDVPIVIAPFRFSEDVPARPPRPQPHPSPTGNPAHSPFASTPGTAPFVAPEAPPPFAQPHTPFPAPPAQAPGAAARAGAAPVRDPRTTQPNWRDLATGTDGLPRAEPRPSPEHANLRLEPNPLEARTPRKPHRPAPDGTLQFLPGRLEIVEGRDVGQEIRFVRQAGATTTEITFGRGDGAPYRHVQLHEPTVSRLHAKITLEDKRWRLTNLSRTNPVVVNGTPLEGEGASHLLAEGDRVEMGEVALRFRTK
jgi:hypothetical protein